MGKGVKVGWSRDLCDFSAYRGPCALQWGLLHLGRTGVTEPPVVGGALYRRGRVACTWAFGQIQQCTVVRVACQGTSIPLVYLDQAHTHLRTY